MCFGSTSSKLMPGHLFYGCLYLHHETAVRADISRQNFTVCPRHWYLDAIFKCSVCREKFRFSVVEQKLWYEDLYFYVDAFPKQCTDCRKQRRNHIGLRNEYDRDIRSALDSNDVDEKARVAGLIDQLAELDSDLPKQIHENRRTLAKQIDRLANRDEN